ncbi:MAG: CoA transferase, partial [Proteobacteria bacterium]|nr:CoA transferase [Pseudomonadota bacterium]
DFYRDARSDLVGPLEGVRVVEATTTWSGPMCGCLLADFGADVIKVEDPRGEIARRVPPFLPGIEPPLSFMHAAVNRNKRSLSLDLRREDGRRVFLELARRSDVVVENFRPGTMDDWGLGFDSVRAENPRIVYVSISGYGQWGPGHERVGYDPLAQAASGYLSLNGDPDGEPVKSPTFLADDLAGLHAALAALAALHHRDQRGEGQHIDVSLLDAMSFQSTGYLTLGAMGVALPRLGNEFRIAAPANTYACRDGRIMAGVLLDSHWKRVAALLGRPELADDPDYATAPARIARREQVDALLADWAGARSVADALARFAEAGIPAAPVRSYAQAAAAPEAQARDMLQSVAQPCAREGAEVPITGPAAKLSRTPTRVRSGAPELGQHNREILAELGYDDDRIAKLERSGALGGAAPAEAAERRQPAP